MVLSFAFSGANLTVVDIDNRFQTIEDELIQIIQIGSVAVAVIKYINNL
jgi:hypothetical protein